jgi:hypothetical protein
MRDQQKITFAEMRAVCWPDDFSYPTLEPRFSSARPAARRVQMSIIPKLAILGLAATLGSPIPQHRIDFSIPGADSQRINQLWLVTYINETGEEVVVQAKLTNGSYAPLIAADPARLESIMPAARDLAKTRNVKMRLIKLTNRVDIEDIVP